MLVAGETSGDMLAAELAGALRAELMAMDTVYPPDLQPLCTGLEPRFFGAGGSRMKAAGVELAFDMTQHSVIGLWEALRNYLKFRRLFHQLIRMARDRRPDIIICVDFAGFNRRFAHAIRKYVRRRQDWFHDWKPTIVQYVSPQVWASREGRAYQIARDYDLLLSIIPFEKSWYASRLPQFRVEFVGHPMADRFQGFQGANAKPDGRQTIVLLPGSRSGELENHMPVILSAMKLIRNALPNARALMVLPDETLAQQARSTGVPTDIQIQIGGLPEALAQADLAIASTGTVTLECAFFGVPTVTLYKTSWITFQIAMSMVKVSSATMPNLLANEEVFPEFLQGAATPENISHAALLLLMDQKARERVKAALARVVAGLGGPGANRRAAKAIITQRWPDAASRLSLQP